MAPKWPKVAGYELIEKIGGGGFSSVYKAVNFTEHRAAACKLITITEDTTEKERKTIDKEMRIHAALKHEYVLEFINAVIVELKHKASYLPGFYLLLEYAGGGDLFDKIAANVGVSEDVAHIYFNQLVSGMSYIHSQGVCHRDLKPENLLLDVTGTLKITDFGLSAVFRLKGTGKQRPLSERCGSLPYVAPELNEQELYEAEPIDVWGVGVILYTMLVGNTPWDEPSRRSSEFRQFVEGTIFSKDPWNRIPHGPLSLIKGMLNVDPVERLTIPQIFQHPWVTRQSQLAGKGSRVLGESLMESLKANGELSVAAPNLSQDVNMDDDGDQIMGSAHQSQFTQTLMLFSQTQSGRRYTPHLTRFYAALGPPLLLVLIQEALTFHHVKWKIAPSQMTERGEVLRLRIGGFDMRKQAFKGWVDVEKFVYRGAEGSFVVMQRDEGSPISWRQLWKGLINSPQVEAHVLRK